MPVPLHSSQQAWAYMHARDRRRSLGIFPRGDRHLIEEFATVAVDHAQQAVLAADGQEVSRLALDRRPKERADLAQVPIVHVVSAELLIPQQLPRLGIERDYRVGIEI